MSCLGWKKMFSYLLGVCFVSEISVLAVFLNFICFEFFQKPLILIRAVESEVNDLSARRCTCFRRAPAVNLEKDLSIISSVLSSASFCFPSYIEFRSLVSSSAVHVIIIREQYEPEAYCCYGYSAGLRL